MGHINFSTTKDEAILIGKIVNRAAKIAFRYGMSFDAMATDMDITAAHCNGCRLKLDELFGSDDANFAHDVFGITKHINRETGKLEDCFCPRFAEPETVSA